MTTSPETIRQIRDRAAELIETIGWVQGGSFQLDSRSQEEVGICLVEAIKRAAVQIVGGDALANTSAMWDTIRATRESVESADPHVVSLVVFNDRWDQTKEKVVELLRRG